MKKIVIIGGGAAGLMAACSANYIYRNGGAEITAVEKNERPARKLMITGKGRCNVLYRLYRMPSNVNTTPVTKEPTLTTI